ncbi:glycerol-3-phosphate ABC transporter ATP-binding protein [Microvirga vignae]|uniref:Glycerol-3-phosphate ABC transporter ATP-binding protein n=1 Tax=Microvirga vignae TaxID=1225564 RepID=A0A0H1RFX4_9HYPH|nr:sn-glycerol-3-phosphate ABC transporter ATP-binding protein UgpC [Microvirga vignae]KLK91507.1 glycerol-3-phosphate ABC transporter ATP-binding protein [Microvirga vignae]
MASIEIQGVGKSYGAMPVLHHVDLSIQDGEFVVLIGPSGCGKSTLLRMIAGLEGITSGAIRIGGQVVNELAPKDRDIAMVFQSYALYPHMTVRDNMSYSLRLRGTPVERMTSVVSAAASKLGLDALLDRKPRTLSGGQRQRVAMGRSIVRQPKAFLFDEPLSNLDARLREQMRVEIKKLHRELGTTSIYVTHDQVEAMTLADRIVAMNGGVIQQVGTPLDLYERPTNLFVAGFIGSPAINILEGRLRCDGERRSVEIGSGERISTAPLAHGHDGQDVRVGIRPEDVQISPKADGGPTAHVELVEPMGLGTIVHIRATHHALKAFVLERVDYPVGTSISYELPASKLHIFDAMTGQRFPE